METVEDMIALKLEVAGCWRRASERWLAVMGEDYITDGQREWLLVRRRYCIAKIIGYGRVNS